MRDGFRLAIASLVLCTFTSAAFAQSDRGTITGTVTDPSGGVVPGVVVTAINTETNESREAVTGDSGGFTITEVKAGPYRVRAELQGFKATEVTDIRVAVQLTTQVAITLTVGGLAETVSVIAEPTTVQTVSAANQTNVTERQVKELPLLVNSESGGRTPLAFVFLDSNVQSSGSQTLSGTNASSFSVGGGQALGTEILIDGAATRRAQNGTFFTEVAPGPNAFQEFTITTSSYSAEFGNSSGGVVNFTLKSGTNNLNGEVYELLRNEKLNANSLTRKANPDPAISGSPARDRQHDFGFNAGGPIWIPGLFNGHDRAFWFFNYEGYRFNRSEDVSISVPTARMRAGDFSELFSDPAVLAQFPNGVQIYNPAQPRGVREPIPGNRLDLYQGGSLIDPVGLAILRSYPEPTSPGVSRNYRASSSAPTDMNNYVGKTDWNLGSRQNLAVSYSFRNLNGYKGGFPRFEQPLSTGTLVANGVWSQYFKSHFMRAQHNYTIGDTVLNHFNFGFTRYDVANQNTTIGFDNTELGFRPNSTQRRAFPAIGIPGYGDPVTSTDIRAYQPIGSTFFNDQLLDDAFQATDYVTWLKGRHTIKAGADFRSQKFDVTQLIHPGGEFNFRHDQTAADFDPNGGWPIASMITGATEFSFNSVQTIDPGWRQFSQSYFVNDDIKVTPALTVNVGLRYDLPGLRTEEQDRFRTFDPNTLNPIAGRNGAIVGAGGQSGLQAQYKTLSKPDRTNIAPRLGAAWQWNDRTVVRGGYGIYYAPVLYGYGGANTLTEGTLGYNSTIAANFTADNNPDLFLRNYRAIPSIDPNGQYLGSDVDYFDLNFRTGRTQQYSADVQRQLPWTMALTVGYIGHHADRLRSDFGRLNALPLNALKLGFPLLNKPLADVSPAERAFAAAAGTPLPASPDAVFPGFTGNVAQGLRPFPQYGYIRNQLESLGTSTYNALNLRLDKRFSHGLQFTTSYTFGHVTTNAANNLFGGSPVGGVLQNPYDLSSLNTISPNSVPHALAISYLLELPFGKGHRFLSEESVLERIFGGWQIGGVHRYQSGLPLVVSYGAPAATDFLNVFGVRGNLRPNLTGQPLTTQNAAEGLRYTFLNQAGFAPPPNYTAAPTSDVTDPAYAAYYGDPNRFFGNAPAVIDDVRGQPVYAESLNVIKKARIGGDAVLEFRAEFFNLFNRHSYFLPAGDINSGEFGVSTAIEDPRVIQLGIRVIF